MESYPAVFQSIGLDSKTIENTLKAKKKAGRDFTRFVLFLIADLMETIKEAGIESGCDRVIGNLMFAFFTIFIICSYNIATTVPTSAVQYRPALVKLVMEKKVKTNLQISEAVAFLKKLPANATVIFLFSVQFQLDQAAFEVACGSGIEVSDEEIQAAVNALIERNKEALVEQRYCFPINQLMYATKEGRMKWADGKKVKDVLDQAILTLLGEKTQADLDVLFLPTWLGIGNRCKQEKGKEGNQEGTKGRNRRT